MYICIISKIYYSRYEPPSHRYESRFGGDRYEPRNQGDRYGPRLGDRNTGDRYESRSGGDRYEPRLGGDRYEGRSGGGRYNQGSQETGTGRPVGSGYRNTTSRYETGTLETTSAADESDTWRRAPTTERRDQNLGGYQSQRHESRVPSAVSSDGETWRRASATNRTNPTAQSRDAKPVTNRYIPPGRRNQVN